MSNFFFFRKNLIALTIHVGEKVYKLGLGIQRTVSTFLRISAMYPLFKNSENDQKSKMQEIKIDFFH